MQARPDAGVRPGSEVVVYCAPGRVLPRQQAPLAARMQQVAMASSAGRKQVVSGRPPGTTSGSSGSMMAHAASVRSVSYSLSRIVPCSRQSGGEKSREPAQSRKVEPSHTPSDECRCGKRQQAGATSTRRVVRQPPCSQYVPPGNGIAAGGRDRRVGGRLAVGKPRRLCRALPDRERPVPIAGYGASRWPSQPRRAA